MRAIVAKTAACSIPATRDERLRHEQDLALLLSLGTRVSIRSIADELNRKDRARIQKALTSWFDDDLHDAWFAVANRSDTRQLVQVLTTS